MILGQIPKTKVGTSRDKRTLYSRRVTSLVKDKYGLYAPKQIRLKSQIEYPAEKTIPVLINNPTTGLRMNVPFSDKNSPIQFLVVGVPALAIVKTKNNVAKIGI
jgi:hypothetical protein